MSANIHDLNELDFFSWWFKLLQRNRAVRNRRHAIFKLQTPWFCEAHLAGRLNDVWGGRSGVERPNVWYRNSGLESWSHHPLTMCIWNSYLMLVTCKAGVTTVITYLLWRAKEVIDIEALYQLNYTMWIFVFIYKSTFIIRGKRRPLFHPPYSPLFI